LCREEASDLCALLRAKRSIGADALPNVVGVVKQQATSAAEESKLGVQEFAEKYFCGALFLDEERKLYEALGSRKLSLPLGKLIFNPLQTYREFKALGVRTKGKGLEGNMQGEGLILGGVLVVSSAGDVVYTYLEETGSELPIADIGKAIDSLSASTATQKP